MVHPLDGMIGRGIRYYHRDGRRVASGEELQALFRAHHGTDVDHPDYFRVAETLVGRWRISTVYLALDHSHAWGEVQPLPLIFETMVFDGDQSADFYTDRYSTEYEAVVSHGYVVARLNLLVALGVDGPTEVDWDFAP